MSNVRLVFSTDPKDKIVSDKDSRKGSNTEKVDVSQFVVIFRLEKGGRGGKPVTVMEGFPRNEEYLKSLAKELKAKCGVGGTHLISEKGGMIEIQGDKRDQLKKILESKLIRYKGM